MKLKLCGITRLEDARYAAAAGVDFLGFIQFEGSPRYVSPRHVRAIVEWIHGPVPVGVFVDAPPDVVNQVADEAGFEWVQLHGDEPPSDVERIECPVIKALRVASGDTTASLRRRMLAYRDVVDLFLLDTWSEHAHGGTGVAFDWRVARGLADEFDFFLAGGIHAGNLIESMELLRPFAIDVSSAVESAPGVKDFAAIDHFMDVFRNTAQDGIRTSQS